MSSPSRSVTIPQCKVLRWLTVCSVGSHTMFSKTKTCKIYWNKRDGLAMIKLRLHNLNRSNNKNIHTKIAKVVCKINKCHVDKVKVIYSVAWIYHIQLWRGPTRMKWTTLYVYFMGRLVIYMDLVSLLT